MDLLNPYNKPEATDDFPWLLGIFFVLCTLLLLGSLFVLIMKDSKKPIREKIPNWAITAAYPTFFLTLPFVCLLTTMLFFPCWWKNCP